MTLLKYHFIFNIQKDTDMFIYNYFLPYQKNVYRLISLNKLSNNIQLFHTKGQEDDFYLK